MHLSSIYVLLPIRGGNLAAKMYTKGERHCTRIFHKGGPSSCMMGLSRVDLVLEFLRHNHMFPWIHIFSFV